MKTKFIPITLALALAAIPPSIQAQDFLPGFESDLSINMTIYSTEPGTWVRDEDGRVVQPREPAFYNEWFKESSNSIQFFTEYKSHVGKSRFSNREMLLFLVDQGVIDAISGWSIKIVQAAEGSAPYIYITKSGEDPIYIGDFFLLEEVVFAEAVCDESVTKTRLTNNGEVTTFKRSGGAIINVLYDITIVFPETEFTLPLNFFLTGFGTFGTKFREVFDEIYYEVPCGGRINVMGSADTLGEVTSQAKVAQALEYSDSGLVEGAWKLSAAKVLDDISILYPDVVVDDGFDDEF